MKMEGEMQMDRESKMPTSVQEYAAEAAKYDQEAGTYRALLHHA
jgi:hypothetical protein